MVQQARMPVDDCVRDVTDDEVAGLDRDGWVQMKGLVSRDLVDELLSQAKYHLEASRDRPGAVHRVWNFAFIARDQRVEPFAGLVLSEKMGKNARRLINRQRLTDRSIPIRYRYDGLLCKEPEGGTSAGDDGYGDGSTPYHQDIPDHGPDRVGELNIWLALSHVTPEMGSMRFLTGSHREGGLGAGIVLGGGPDVLGQYPKLLDFYDLSPPLSYEPGDATVHSGFMVHGAPKNQSSETRWSYIMSYFPADVRFTPPTHTQYALRGGPRMEKATSGAQAAGSNDSFATPEANNLDVEYPIVCP